MAEGTVLLLLDKLTDFVQSGIQQSREGAEEVISLKREFEHVKAFLRTADSMEEHDEEVKVWVKQIREVAYEAEDVLDEYRLHLEAHARQSDSFFSRIPSIRSVKARSRLIASMKNIRATIKEICKGHSRLHGKFKDEQSSTFSGEDNRWQDHRGDALLVEESDLVGIEEHKQKLVGWLVEGKPEREVISVVGMGGLGKTTLVKKVYDDPVVKKHFAIRAWVTLSPSSKTEETLLDMLRQIASGTKKTIPSRADALDSSTLRLKIKEFLQERGSSYLIVLDDAWNTSKLDAVKGALPNNENGSRIMVTTRNTDVASTSCLEFTGQVYQMQPLSDEQSRELFQLRTFKEKAWPTHLEDTCKHILRKCEGLPLAVVAISGVLATKDTRRIDEWVLVQRSLRSEIDGNDKLKNLKQVLSLSFNDLPYFLKSCFLHLSIFPEAHIIERMRVIRLWVAEGFVERKEGKTLEEVAEDYLDELLNRSLIQVAETTTDGRVKTCRVHDLLREIIISKSRDQNYAVIDHEQRVPSLDRVRRLSMHTVFHIAQTNTSLSHLRSLFMIGVDKSSIDEVLSSDHKLLRVLDLRKAPMRSFPSQVLDMYCLRFLSLRSTQVQTIPSSIGNLQNLETLDLKDTHVTALPTEIMKLQQLRHLLVYRYETIGYENFKYGFNVSGDIGALRHLQKLCYIEVGDERSNSAVRELGKLDQMRRLCVLKLKREDGELLCSSIAKLTNLCSLAVYARSDDEEIDLIHLSSPPPLLQRVYLRGHLRTLPSWIANLHSLIKLHLRCSRLNDDPLEPLQNLPNLVHLELLRVYDWEIFRAKRFMKLKSLGLDHFEELKYIQLEEGAMPCLEKLIIQRCKQLKDLPQGIEQLNKLKVLELFDVPDELVRKLKPDDKDYQKVAHIPELHYAYWRDAGWDVTSVETLGDEDGSRSQSTSMRNTELPPCWK